MLRKIKAAVGTVDVRAKVVYWARWGVSHEPAIHYRESRPMPLTSKLPLITDCSGFVTLCYYLAGAPDPNGRGYDGQGYTGTLLAHGQHIPLSHVKPGDVVVYGPGTGWHTALIIEAGPDPLTVSHGREAGPELCRVSQDGRQPQTYLRFPTTRKQAAAHIPHAAPVPAKRQPSPTVPPKAAGNSPAHTGAAAKKRSGGSGAGSPKKV